MLSAAAAPVRSLVAAALFAASIFNRVFKSFGFYLIKSGLSNLSLRTLSKQLVSFSLIFSILTTSTPAASTVPTVTTGLIIGLGEIGQDIRYSYLAGFLGSSETTLSSIGNSLASTGYPGNPVIALIIGTGKHKKQQQIARIEIAPGQAVIREGEQIAFTAVAYDSQNNPVQGVGFDWTAVDSQKKAEAEPLPTGVFDPDYPGWFTVTAQAGGIANSIRVLVIPDAPFKALREISEKGTDKQQIIKQATGKPKALRKEVTNLMAQPLPDPINNSTRMTKETVKELEKWDKEQKRLQAAAAKIIGQTGHLDKEADRIAAINSKSIFTGKGGPSADDPTAPELSSPMGPTGQITGVDSSTRAINGWAYESGNGGVYTVIYIDNSYLGYTFANLPGCPPTGGNCSFSYVLPAAYADGVQHTVSAETYGNSGSTILGSVTFTISEAGQPKWKNSNFYTADDPGLQPGVPANTGTAGAGSENFSFSAPIVSLGGRGLNVNLSLSYNSLLWHQANGEIIYDIDKGNPGPGWSLLGIGKLMDMDTQGGSMMVDMDGTRHSYEGTLRPGTPGYSTYYGHTTDGSFIDYVSYRDSNGIYNGNAQLPNGTIITYGAPADGVAYPTQIKDRSGNYINIAYLNNQGPNISTITDTEGRVIQFQYDANNYLLSVSGPKINPTGIGQNTSATQTYVRIHHRYQQLSYNFSGLTPLVRNSNPYVIDAIYYPTKNTGYWFGDSDSYSTYGMIAKVVEQRGMSWTPGSGQPSDEQGTITQGAMTRQMTYNYPLTAGAALASAPQYTQMTEDWAGRDVPSPAVMTYNVNSNANPRTTSVTLPNGNTVKQSSKYNPGVWDDGLLYQVEMISPSNQVLSKSNTFWEIGAYGAPRVTEADSTDELNQTTKQTFAYDTVYNQVTVASEFGYSNDLLRKTIRTYENRSSYTGNRHIFSLVKTEEVLNASNTRLRRTDYTYDGSPLLNTPGVVSYDQNYNTNTPNYYAPPTDARGNVTKTTVYEDAANLAGAISYDSTYDITGNARTITTDCCQQMSFTYTANTQYSQPESHTKGSATDPNDQMTESAIYDFNTGLMVHSTDFNGRQTTYYYDGIERPVQTILPTGGKSVTVYDDANLTVTQTAQLADNTVASKSVTAVNGRGQAQVSQQWTGTGWNASAARYDIMGRTVQSSLPYDAAGQPTQWTTYTYDVLSRVAQVTAPDGSTSKTFYNEAQKPDSASVYPGNYVRSQDAWGRERWARTDALGRVAEVVEPAPAGSGSVFSAGSLATQYQYDPVDQLVGVTQGAQNRSFAYDSLGRLIRQKLAEQNASLNAAGQFVGGNNGQWSDAFVYDQRSNLIRRTDARGVKTNFNYLTGTGDPDPLNRLLSVSYDKSTADPTYNIPDASPVTLNYMTAGDKTRVGTATTWWTTEENVYDAEGRISDYKLTLPNNQGNPLVTHYDYDTVNRLTQVNYPAQLGAANPYGKIVNPTYDETSRLKELKVDNQIQMSEIIYNPMSQVTQLKTGAASGNADIETYSYDNQTGLLTNQKVIKQNSNQTLLDLSYEYNRGNSNGNLNGKTGQLTHITNNLDRNKDRVFEFDTLGRLVNAKGGGATGVSGVTANWTQSYLYDRYGNRTNVTASGTTQNSQAVPADGLASQSYDQPSNRINTSGYIYDLAGNLVRGQDASGNWQRYEYDAAGRLIHVKDDAGNDKLNNGYTSSRQRLVSWQPGVTDLTWFVWGGQSVIAEYKSTTWGNDPLVWQKSYIYAGSRLLSTYTNNGAGGETVEYHHPDRLGTKLVTNNVANTSFEQSTLPFGTALDAEAIGTNTTNQKFTSYDRSAVTGIDYAVNRSYSAAQGRFTSVDPIGMSATSIGNPQSMNLYAYVQNNPVDNIDPNGLLRAIDWSSCRVTGYVLHGRWDGDVFYWDGSYDEIQTCNTIDIDPIREPIGGGGGGGGVSPTEPEKPEPQQQNCSSIGQRIKELRDELAKRADDLRRDDGNLPATGKNSIAGHKQQFENKQTELQNALNEYASRGCGGPGGAAGLPADAWRFAWMQTPSKQVNNSNRVNTGIKIAAGIGIGYLIYRGIRLLPSFAPPLWWTLPANLAIP